MSENELVLALINELKNRNISFKREVYVKSHIADIVIDNRIAIEAKLLNIDKAIFQCVAYLSKFDHVYIYMPESKESLVKKKKIILRKLGIKWFFLTKDNKFEFGDKRWKKHLFI